MHSELVKGLEHVGKGSFEALALVTGLQSHLMLCLSSHCILLQYIWISASLIVM